MSEEREGLAGIVGHEKGIYVASRCLFASGEGAEELCFQDGLGLEVVGYRLLHCLGAHKRIVLWVTAANLRNVSDIRFCFSEKVKKRC